jgi:hypothetical protein
MNAPPPFTEGACFNLRDTLVVQVGCWACGYNCTPQNVLSVEKLPAIAVGRVVVVVVVVVAE